MDKKQYILDLVEQYVSGINKSTWVPGIHWVQYAGPYFTSDEYKSAITTLLNEWLALGSDSLLFEKNFSILLGKSHGIVTNSGSSSNLLMMAAMFSPNLYDFDSFIKIKSRVNGLKSAKVLVPVAGFPTTVNPIIQNGFTPIFCDIELDTLNIDINEAERLLEQHGDIKIITFAHVLGNPPNMNRIMELVKKYNLVLLEDVCDGLGTTYNGKPLGSFGEFASCSFYPAHHITGGEGGFLACNTKEQERVIRSLREWGRGCYCTGKAAGLSKKGCCGKRFSAWVESMPDVIFDHKYVYDEIGYNLKPIELQCSILNAQLKKLPEIIRLRKRNYEKLYEIFSKYEDVFILPKPTAGADVSWFAFPVTVKENEDFTKNDFTMSLEDNKIQTRNYFGGNLLLQPAYQKMGYDKEYALSFKIATYAMRNTFFLGVSPVITDEQIEYIGKIVNNFFK